MEDRTKTINFEVMANELKIDDQMGDLPDEPAGYVESVGFGVVGSVGALHEARRCFLDELDDCDELR